MRIEFLFRQVYFARSGHAAGAIMRALYHFGWLILLSMHVNIAWQLDKINEIKKGQYVDVE
jgi:hypothetical protein